MHLNMTNKLSQIAMQTFIENSLFTAPSKKDYIFGL